MLYANKGNTVWISLDNCNFSHHEKRLLSFLFYRRAAQPAFNIVYEAKA